MEDHHRVHYQDQEAIIERKRVVSLIVMMMYRICTCSNVQIYVMYKNERERERGEWEGKGRILRDLLGFQLS